ncbi:outer membrane biogenesis protein BamB [Thalassoglobus neptunius]|uniref:Outer membrane biogenesis protein BamB n=1 Tax=Thalassoglobus neptunius TaxID=1938619 RepID=A0A5C5X8R2_9PLAN|nr:PQQ-binding-like beta-propeller repeat protein [Thalassoglobus neptunius]TWT58751.1 outer membrane biogenesis protein BamB [Thalassoglobus neptunius]
MPPVRVANLFLSVLVCTMLAVLAALTSVEAEEWTRFRGPNGEGKSSQQGFPTNWEMEDYEWVVELPGKGHSSPAVWNDSLFLTAGLDDGTRIVLCVDALTGEIRWEDSIQLGANHLHKKNSYASGTPAVDGERVFVVFADDNHYTILAYDFAGERIWSRDLGSFTSQHGQGVSPIVYDGKVIVPDDQMGPSKIVALDVASGEQVWESERDFRRTSYATPLIVNIDGKDQLVCLSGALGLSGLDPQTGKQLWFSGELPDRTVASPAYGEGLLTAICGKGGRGTTLALVRADGKGEVVNMRTRNLPYVPTPIIHEGHLFLWNDGGVVCCIDLSGDLEQNVWMERVGGNFSGSPVLIDGKLYCISEEGEVVVIDASPEFHLYGKSPIGDNSYSTPAVANCRLYLRGFGSLACLRSGTRVTQR